MELAKIRTKAQQEISGKAVAEPVIDEPKIDESAQPPALTLPDDIFDGVIEEVVFPGPAPVFVSAAPVRFDPLAKINAGREADKASELQLLPISENSSQDCQQEEYQEFLCFRLCGEEYGINIMEIKEIIKPRELTEVPRAPEFIDGILSLRGVIVPVIDMRRRLSLLSENVKGHQRIVIVKRSDALAGLRVDEVTGVVRILASRREATPAVLDGVDREFVAGIGRTDNQMVILLDVRAVADVALGIGA